MNVKILKKENYIYSLKKNVKHRELRGGCYYSEDESCRITDNFKCRETTPGYRYYGFRVVRTI